MEQDIRWKQRFSNFKKVLGKLTQAVVIAKEEEEQNKLADELDEIIKEGLIQRFEYTHELAWNVMKGYAEYQSNNEIRGSRDATREGFSMKLIDNGDEWMAMIGSRNQTAHTYNQEVADEIYGKIIDSYHELFCVFEIKMDGIIFGEQTSLYEN